MEALATRFQRGASMVFEQTAECTPVSIAQVPRPAGTMVPVNTIRMEGSGRRVSPSSSGPLFTDLQTAERQRLPHGRGRRHHAMVPASVAGRMDLPSTAVIPSDVAVAHDRAEHRGARRRCSSSTVITEMRNPPVTIIEQDGTVRVQRY